MRVSRETNGLATVTALACHVLAVSRNKLTQPCPLCRRRWRPERLNLARFFAFLFPTVPNHRLTTQPVRKLMTQHRRSWVKDLLQVLRDLPRQRFWCFSDNKTFRWKTSRGGIVVTDWFYILSPRPLSTKFCHFNQNQTFLKLLKRNDSGSTKMIESFSKLFWNCFGGRLRKLK